MTFFCVVIQHELCHMWFGNLVTMNWWNDLWLNEAFATALSYKACAEGATAEDTFPCFSPQTHFPHKPPVVSIRHPCEGRMAMQPGITLYGGEAWQPMHSMVVAHQYRIRASCSERDLMPRGHCGSKHQSCRHPWADPIGNTPPRRMLSHPLLISGMVHNNPGQATMDAPQRLTS